jgi:hypothetical protein
MRLSELNESDKQLDELLPALGAVAGGIARGAATLGGAALRGGAALAKGVGSAVSQGAKAAGQATSGLAGGGMDPAQAAAAAKERQDMKKEVQDQIKAKQQELQDLQKKLAELG